MVYSLVNFSQLSVVIMPFSRTSKDLIVALVCSFVALSLAAYFDINESYIEWAEEYEEYELDELPVAAAAFAISFGWFSWRRWAELRLAQRTLEVKLQEIHALQLAEQQGKQYAVQKSHQLALVGEMTESLLISDSEVEALRIFNSYFDSFIEAESSAVIVKDVDSGDNIVSRWRSDSERFDALDFSTCWSHRSGKVYDTGMAFCERSCGICKSRQICIPVSNAGNCHGVIAVELSDSEERDAAILTETLVPAASVLAITLSSLSLRSDLFKQSIVDPLTGLYNRRGWQARVQAILDDLPVDTAFSVINIDVDHFKQVNDSLGHDAGDKTLILLAGVIRSCIRTMDLAARIGGDEILLLLPEMDNQQAVDKAQYIVQRFKEGCSRQFAEQSGLFSLSIGIVTYPDDGVNLDELVVRSDSFLYAAKQQGRGRIITDNGREGDVSAAEKLAAAIKSPR